MSAHTIEIDPEVKSRREPLTSAPADDELRQLRDALRGTLGTAKDDAVPSPNLEWRLAWSGLAELGLTGFCIPEAAGGFGLRVDAATTTAAELGAALHGSPYAGLVAGTRALSAVHDDRASELAARVLSGAAIVAWGRLDPRGGAAHLVDGAADADALVLCDPSDGSLLLLDDPSTWSTQDGSTFDVTRRCTEVTADTRAGFRLPGDDVARSLHGLLLAADALGCVQRMLDRTVAYAGQRQAFGKVIGGFQAVQHRLVDHSVRVRGMTLLVAEAARRLGADAPDAHRHVTMAELSVSTRATHVLHDLLQLTGAIGFTWEYGLHLYERRVHHDARLAGNPRTAARTLTGIEGWNRAG